MANLFKKTTDQAQTPRELLQGKYRSARSNLLIAMAFTVINIIIAFVDGSSYFLFSLFVPYFLALMGLLFTGNLSEDWYTDWADFEVLDSAVLVLLVGIAAVILVLYLLCWIFSKKEKAAPLICALVLVSIDTAVMLLVQGIAVDCIVDIVFHVWVIVSFASGIRAANKLKALPDDTTAEYAENDTSAWNTPVENTTETDVSNP